MEKFAVALSNCQRRNGFKQKESLLPREKQASARIERVYDRVFISRIFPGHLLKIALCYRDPPLLSTRSRFANHNVDHLDHQRRRYHELPTQRGEAL